MLSGCCILSVLSVFCVKVFLAKPAWILVLIEDTALYPKNTEIFSIILPSCALISSAKAGDEIAICNMPPLKLCPLKEIFSGTEIFAKCSPTMLLHCSMILVLTKPYLLKQSRVTVSYIELNFLGPKIFISKSSILLF